MERERDDGGFLGRPAWLWSTAALVLGLVASLAVAWVHHRSLARTERAELERRAQVSFDTVEVQLRSCGLLVRSVQALFLSSDQVTPAEFESMYANLRPRELFPSLQAVAFAAREPGDDGRVHFPTRLIAPLAGNERLRGLDVASQPANLRGVLASRDSDEPAMSGAFTLIQRQGLPGKNHDGITIRLPAYSSGQPPTTVASRRERFIGSIGASFQVRTLIEEALPPETLDTMDVHVADVTDGQHWPLFVEPMRKKSAAGELQSLDDTFHRDLRFGGRTWRMELTGHPGGNDLVLQPLLSLGGGVLATLLLASLTWSIATTRRRALVLARDMSTQFRESEARFRALNELLPTLVLLARPDGSLVYANRSARERLGLPDPATTPASLYALCDDPVPGQAMRKAAEAGLPVRNMTVRCSGPSHDPFWANVSVSPIELDGRPHLLAVANDITELRDLNEMLSYQASHDSLTGLNNRREFGRRLDLAIGRVEAGGPASALLYFDLDQFKIINDTSGHHRGDQLLSQLAALLGSHLVEGETIARLGGDEFGILLEPASRERALEFAERMRLEVDGFVFGADQRTYAVSVSVGLVLIDRPGLSRREVLSLADTACYMAKERGRNRVHLYSENDAETTQRRSELEWASRLRQALIDGRFVLHFQEIRALNPSAHAGAHVELLIRLRDEDGGMVPPGAFIPAAERFGLMLQLDRWVVDTALANFDRLHPSGEPLAMCAINLSALTVEDEGFAPFVLERLERHGVPADRVCFEITETAAVASMVRVVGLMDTLRAAGCKFSLDDFGAGMASFGYLKNLPVDYVKIDGSFIRNIDTDPISQSIVRAVTEIGHQLKLCVVAEWVGDARAMAMLAEAGVDYAQGYFVHMPEPTALFAT
jgi:diguanylate cyclase (GGDEF)-like protein/PAS domain S-box-containing protein